jgi:hypothetical protein
MMQGWLVAIAGALLGPAPLATELKLEGIQAAYGKLGPERPSLDFYHGDEVFFRYLITGVQRNADGGAKVEVTILLNGPDGKAMVKQTAPAGESVLALGGDILPGSAFVRLPDDIDPGTYTMVIRVTDQLSSRSAQFQRRFTVKPAAFAVIMPRFFYDREGKVPAPAGGVVGQALYFRLNLIGFERSQGKIDAAMDFQVLDAAGQETMPKPIQARLEVNNPKEAEKVNTLTFSGNLDLNRAGVFTLRITLTDRLANKTTRFEAPLRVTAP